MTDKDDNSKEFISLSFNPACPHGLKIRGNYRVFIFFGDCLSPFSLFVIGRFADPSFIRHNCSCAVIGINISNKIKPCASSSCIASCFYNNFIFPGLQVIAHIQKQKPFVFGD